MRATVFVLVLSSFLAALGALGSEDEVCDQGEPKICLLPVCMSQLSPLSTDGGQIDPLCNNSPQSISTATSSSTAPPFRRTGETNAENGGSAGGVLKLQTFPGLNQGEAQSGESPPLPPDTTLAVSPKKVLEVVNYAVALSDRDGSHRSHVPLQQFFGGQEATTGGIFDPKAYYDPVSERMFVAALWLNDQVRQSWLYLAVSRDQDPSSLDADQWCTYRMAGAFCDADGAFCDTFADRTGLGMNDQWVAITTDQISFNRPLLGLGRSVPYALLRVIDKKALVDNADTCPSVSTSIFQIDRNDGYPFLPFIEPVKSLDETDSPLYLLSNEAIKASGSYSYYLWEVVPHSKTGLMLRIRDLSAGHKYYGPTNKQRIDQPASDASLDGGYANIQQVIQQGGKLWASHTNFMCVFGIRHACARVVSIDVKHGLDHAEVSWVSDVFKPGDHTNRWMPAVTINTAGDLMLVYQTSSSAAFLGTGFATRRASKDHYSSWLFHELAEGACALKTPEVGGQKNRTGDYVAAQTDPLDGRSFWIAGEYTEKLERKCEWATRIGYVNQHGAEGEHDSSR